MSKISKMTEIEMREVKVPTFKTLFGLIFYIIKLQIRKHDYGTVCYAISMASVATFNYMAHKLHITGFQASCADLDILRRTRRLELFRIVDYSKLLYPQYINGENFPSIKRLVNDNKEYLSKKASEFLKDNKRELVHPDVWRHWENLASMRKDEKKAN